jgi:hypothetical protein
MNSSETPHTRKAKIACRSYLADRGFKITETEVGYNGGKYIADVMGYNTYPLYSELIKFGLIEPHKKSQTFGEGDNSFDIFFNDETEANKLRSELGLPLIALIEVKTSRADFLRDKEKFSGIYAHLNFLAAPRAVLSPQEVPSGWWWLRLNDDCERVTRLYKGGKTKVLKDSERLAFVMSITNRNYNVERYSNFRNMIADIKEREDEYMPQRYYKVLQGIDNYLSDKRGLYSSLEHALYCNGIIKRNGAPRHVIRLVNKIDEAIKKARE